MTRDCNIIKSALSDDITLTTKTELYYRLLRRYMKQALACSQQYLKLIFTDILNLYLIFLS